MGMVLELQVLALLLVEVFLPMVQIMVRAQVLELVVKHMLMDPRVVKICILTVVVVSMAVLVVEVVEW